MLHSKKRLFLDIPAFFSQSDLSLSFLNNYCSDWLEKSRPSKIHFFLDMYGVFGK